MSLLGNQNNDFEKKLKKHLGDTEYKPAESLWDRIDKEVNKPEFEQKVEGKIGHYELAPKPETWEYIEANLPPEPKSWKRTGKIWYGIVALLFISGAFIGYQLNGSFNHEPAEALAQQHGTDIADVGNEMPAIAETSESLKQTQSKPAITAPVTPPAQQTQAENRSTTQRHAAEIGSIRSSSPETHIKGAAKPVQRENVHHTSLASTVTLPVGNATFSASGKPDQTPEPVSVASNTKSVTGLTEETRLQTTLIAPGQTGNAPASNIPVQGSAPLAQKENTEKQNTTDLQSKESNPVKPEPDKLAAKDPGPVSQVSDTTRPAVERAVSTGKPVAQANDSLNGLPFAAIDNQIPVRLSITVMAGVHQSNMRLVAPASMQANKTMRERVETPEWDFTGGFLLDYKLNEHVLISSGIILTSFTMGMKYDALPANRSARMEPGATYENSRDSIVSGNGLTSRIKYSWNEIPLFVTYRFNTTKRFGFEVRGGISYAIVSTVDASMVGQDNIGVLVMKTKESFPVFQNSIFTHLYAGISYKLNETVSLNAMPYLKYSLNSMVENEKWIQQHPWMVGLSMGLRKSF